LSSSLLAIDVVVKTTIRLASAASFGIRRVRSASLALGSRSCSSPLTRLVHELLFFIALAIAMIALVAIGETVACRRCSRDRLSRSLLLRLSLLAIVALAIFASPASKI
jgi:hypothetical protein